MMYPTRCPDWYQVLGVPATASSAQITRAYRAGLRTYHPDTRDLTDPADPVQVTAADSALDQLRAAYAVLGDPARRAAYDHDQRLESPTRAGRAPAPIPVHHHNTGNHADACPIRVGPVHWGP